MEKINIAELLRNCPQGMELNCTLYYNVFFDKICEDDLFYPIKCYTIDDGIRNSVDFTKYGEFHTLITSKCVIFPKGKTTWEGFIPPCKFKDGDIIADEHGNIAIYKGTMWYNKKLAGYYCGYRKSDNRFLPEPKRDGHFGLIEELHHATEEEKEKLFQVIIDNGYRWNTESKALEKLPKFKVGDRVIRTATHEIYIIDHITSSGYVFKNEGGIGFIFEDERLYELAPNKFDINTLVPFESRVLVRYNEESKWCPAVWGFYDYEKGLPHRYVVVGGISFAYCIPYEGNEHLRGKVEDCKNFYKIWE